MLRKKERKKNTETKHVGDPLKIRGRGFSGQMKSQLNFLTRMQKM